jgi:carboxylate-amine ligase
VDSLLKSGVITDPSRLYWDVRLALSYPTVETRAMDAMTSLDDLLVLVGLIRGLVTASLGATDLGWRAPPVRGEVLRAASWYAARYGLADDLIDVLGPRHTSVRSVVDLALRVARPHLEEAGDFDFVKDGLDRMIADGGGAARQRRAYERGGLWAVVDDLTDGFLEGTDA